MFLPGPLFQRKDLASSFLSVDHEALQSVSFPPQTLAGLPENALSCTRSIHAHLKRWEQSIDAYYVDAFNRSGRVVELALEKKNFEELKAISRRGVGELAFLESLLKDTPHNDNQSMQNTHKLRDLKRECKQLVNDNSALAKSIATLDQQLATKLAKAEGELQTLSSGGPDTELTWQQTRTRINELITTVGNEEQVSANLLSEIAQAPDLEGMNFEEALKQEETEIAVIKQSIESQKENTFTDQKQKELEKHKTERIIREMQQVCAFLAKVGGTEVEYATANTFLLKLRTDVGVREPGSSETRTRRFFHQLTLEIDASTFHVRSAKLQPDEGIDLHRIVSGLKLTSSLAHTRSLLYIALTRKAQLEALSSYKFISVNPESGIWRVVLSHNVEVEIAIPGSWPFERHSEFQLLDIQAPSMAYSFENLVAEIQKQRFVEPQALLLCISQSLQQQQSGQFP